MIRKDHVDQEIMKKVQLFVAGELEDAEHKEVFDWISSRSRNRRYYYGLLRALRVAEYYRSEKKYDKEIVRSRLNKRIKLTDKAKKTDYRILFRVAASLLLLGTTYIIFQSIRDHKAIQSDVVIHNTIESPFGSRARIYLPDSTYVVLNAGRIHSEKTYNMIIQSSLKLVIGLV